jgi:hypothetical protein
MPNKKNADSIELELNEFEVKQSLLLLNSSNVAKAPLMAIKAMMELIDVFKALEFENEEETKNIEFDATQWQYYYATMTHKGVMWTISQKVLDFQEKLEAVGQ